VSDGAEERGPQPPRIEHEGVYVAGQRKHHEFVQWMVDRGDPFSLYLAETTPDLPRGEVDPAALGEAVLARGRELAVDAFPALMEDFLAASETLKTFLAGFEPLDVIASISLRQMFIVWGTYYEPAEERSEIVVEIVVGLYASLGPDVHGTVRPTAHDLNEVEEQVQNIRNLVFLYNFAGQMAGEMSGIEGTSAAYWMNVRGAGHRAHAYQIAEHIYTATQRFFEPIFGFTITQYLHLVDAIETLVQDRVTAYAHRPDVGQSGGKVEELRDLLELSSEDLVEPSGLPREVVRLILERLSLSLPADVPARYSGPFDECPLARRPFVKSGDERYLLPIFGIAGRDFISVFDPELMREGREPYSLARALASDDYAIELLARVLPGCETASHLFYDVIDGTTVERCEVDGVVEFEDYLIIVEGKASSISVAAQRGDVRKAASQVAEVIGRAWEQADRLKRLVIENDATDLVNGDGDVARTLGRFLPDRVLLINPTLYCLGLLSLVVPTLQQVYEFDVGSELWSLCLSDLQVVVEILDDPALFLHYFQWRIRLPIGETMFVVDESDLLAGYLHGLVGNEPDMPIYLTASTSSFDDYFLGLDDDGPLAPRPKRSLGHAVETRLRKLGSDRPKRWLPQSFALLDLSDDGAFLLEEMLVAADGVQLERGDFRIGDADGVGVVLIGSNDSAESLYLKYRAEVEGARGYIVVQARAAGSAIVWSARL
jgi:hypothetical protein